ncbi:hypothetical protein PS2015_740 [Pseudohongiella spirulinae]|uniref:PET hydrolase/cutinase-like domain-containing protein n=2 Tax=Pseudohongiella spirulinae TaxID=1249552 RepID=A0A0S2KB11_9GAMM|nr:hypothetical protein PS2015_740 [Pseudohongiella spirulinae]
MLQNLQNRYSRYLLLLFTVVWLSACASGQAPSGGSSPEELTRNGPYEIRSYIGFEYPAEYLRATIYYPLNVDRPVGGIAISPGFTQLQRHNNWWGARLASHGYAVLVLDTNDLRDRPEQRAEALFAGIRTLRQENARGESPLYQQLDNDRMAVMGHSMGGGGALLAAQKYGDQLKAAIPYTPWQPDADFSGITIPTLIFGGEDDRIAPVADHARIHFDSLPDTTEKVYLEVAGGDHFIANNQSGHLHGMLGKYALAWLKLHLDGDESYRDMLYGNMPTSDRQQFSRVNN